MSVQFSTDHCDEISCAVNGCDCEAGGSEGSFVELRCVYCNRFCRHKFEAKSGGTDQHPDYGKVYWWSGVVTCLNCNESYEYSDSSI